MQVHKKALDLRDSGALGRIPEEKLGYPRPHLSVVRNIYKYICTHKHNHVAIFKVQGSSVSPPPMLTLSYAAYRCVGPLWVQVKLGDIVAVRINGGCGTAVPDTRGKAHELPVGRNNVTWKCGAAFDSVAVGFFAQSCGKQTLFDIGGDGGAA